MKLEWSERARRDLKEAADYIRQDNPTAAKRWVGHIRSRIKQALVFPRGARPAPYVNDESVRELIDGNYHVVYRIKPDRIVVVTVYERHRRFPELGDSDTPDEA